jgi:hypothetical protein
LTLLECSVKEAGFEDDLDRRAFGDGWPGVSGAAVKPAKSGRRRHSEMTKPTKDGHIINQPLDQQKQTNRVNQAGTSLRGSSFPLRSSVQNPISFNRKERKERSDQKAGNIFIGVAKFLCGLCVLCGQINSFGNLSHTRRGGEPRKSRFTVAGKGA